MSKEWAVTLAHGRIGVRPLVMKDASRWAALRDANTAWLAPWEATVPPGSKRGIASYREMIRTLRSRARQGQTMPFIITYDGKMVGQLTVSGLTQGSARWGNIGYWIVRDHAGLNITPTAVALVCDHLLFTMGLHRLEIAIRPENAASLRVVEKLGFTEYGMAPRYLHIAGDWRDHRLFQILSEDVPERLISRLPASETS